MVTSKQNTHRGSVHLNKVWVILAIVVLVIGGFVLLSTRDSEFVGQSIKAPEKKSSDWCDAHGSFGSTHDAVKHKRGVLCDEDGYWECCKEGGKDTCKGDNRGYIKTVGEESYLCRNNEQWQPCDSKGDGIIGGPAIAFGASTGGPLGDKYSSLCYDDKWYQCPQRKDSGDSAEFAISVGPYICSTGGWFSCSGAGCTSWGPTGDGSYITIIENGKVKWVAEEDLPPEAKKCTSNTISDDKKSLCKSEKWVKCDSNNKGVSGVYNCDGSQWKECNNNQGFEHNGYICQNKEWVACSSSEASCEMETDTVGSDIDLTETFCSDQSNYGKINVKQEYCSQDGWKLCGPSSELRVPNNYKQLCYQGTYIECKDQPVTQGAYYCDNKKNQWAHCIGPTYKDVLNNQNKQFYCKDNLPQVCSGSTDDTQKENTLLCQDSEWKTCSGNDVSANGHYKCNQNVWKKCEKNNEISGKFICKVDTWQPLESSKVAPTGYYWEEAPIPQSDLGNTEQIVTEIFDGLLYTSESPTSDQKFIGVCSSNSYCTGYSYDTSVSEPFCYAQDSLSSNEGQLCKQHEGKAIWLKCDGKLKDNAVQEDGKWLCVNQKWEPCNKKYPLKGDNQYYCDLSVSKWIQCDDEWDDQSSPDGNYACSKSSGSYKWSNEVVLGLNDFFEITLGQDESLDVASPLKDYKAMNICDPPNPPAFSVKVCDDDKTRSVNSVQHLKGTATNIHVEGDIVYVFEEEEPREVSLIYLVDIDELPLIDFATLGQNFEQGRRLAIRVYSTAAKDTYQIYMLSHDGANFDFKNLHLHLLPGMVEYENEQLTSDKHQFKIQATKVILIQNLLDGQGKATGNIKISLGKPELAIAGQLLDHDLENEFEVRLDRANPVRLTDFFSTELYVCQTDSDLQPKNMQICLPDPNTGEKNVPFVTLERDELIKTTLSNKPVALLYQLVNGKKQASIFWLDDKVLDKTGFEVSQEFFILSMVASDKRMAVEFEDNLYLLDHSNGVVDLSSITLSTYQPFDDPTQGEPILTYPTESTNEIKIDVPVLGGKVYVEQLFGEPDATIKLSAKTNLQITSEPLSLLTEFSTSMSSQTSVAINQPTNFDIISRSLNDNQIVLNKFKLDLQGPKEEISLIQKEPQVIDNTLFYYYGSNGLIKGVKIHLLYDLKNKNVYDLTEEYSKSFLGGGELALKFGSSYYLVTHAADSVAFDFPKLQLTELITGTEQEVVESTTTSTIFQVAEGKVRIYEKDDKIHFEKITQDDLITTALGIIDHSFILTPANKVELDDVVFDICGTGDAALKKEIVRVCKDGNKLEPMMLVDEQILDDKEDPKYLLWYHGLVSGEKTVTVHTIHELNPGVVSEVHHLTENLLALQTKAYLFDGTYFQLAGTAGDFSTYKLYSIPAGEKLALQNLKKSAYQVENGTYSYNQKLLFAQEKWGVDEQGKPTDNITLTLKPLLGKLVTSTGFNVTFTESALIVPAVGEPEYVLITQADVDNVKELADKLPKTVTVAIRDVEDEDNYYYYAKLPLGISTQVLLPNGKVVGIYVEDALGWLEREAKLNGVEVGDLADEDVGLPQITITK